MVLDCVSGLQSSNKNKLYNISLVHLLSFPYVITTVNPKVSGLAAWSENCKWYSSLPLGAVISLFCETVQ
jgi:hypothetical protein